MKNIALASPSKMSASARADEIASILAAVIVRTLLTSKQTQRAIDLDFLPDQRVHTTPYQEEKL